MKTVFLHIGLHKTGSTALQRFLAESPDVGAQGYLYPLTGRPPQAAISHGHHQLAWALFRDPGLMPLWALLRDEVEGSKAGCVVLSSEEFDVLDEEQIGRLRSELSDWNVQVFAYLRRQDTFIQAYYVTDVLFNGEARSFQEYIASPRTDLDYRRLLDRWSACFGRENLHVGVYERSALRGEDIVDDFTWRVGLRVDASTGRRRSDINRGYPKNVVDLARNVRRLSLPARLIDDLLAISSRLYPVHEGYDIVAPSVAAAILDKYRESNSAVAEAYLGRGALFAEGPSRAADDEWWSLYGAPYSSLAKTASDIVEYLERESR